MYINSNYGIYNRLMTSGTNSIYSRLYSQVLSPKGTSLYDSKGFINTSSIQYVQNLKTAAKDLKSAVDQLSRPSSQQNATAASSNEKAMSVQASASSRIAEDTTVSIDQVATGQVNKGEARHSAEGANLEGYQQFEIDVGGKKHQVSFTAQAEDTNLDIQLKMANAINQKNIGVNAQVISENGQRALMIAANNTGENKQSRFTVSDVKGGAAEEFGLSNILQDAQNAKYRVNGGEVRTSQSNTVDIGNGVKATLKEASEDPVTVSMTKDTKDTLKKIDALIDSYNEMLSVVDERDDPSANQLRKQLTSLTRSYASSLKEAGIEIAEGGYLTIDPLKMAEAAKEAKIEQFFQENRSVSFGFSNRLSRIADEVNTNPARYLAQEKTQQPYSSVLSNKYYNMVPRSQFYQAYNMGLLFDFWL